jgi:hypothetical protein
MVFSAGIPLRILRLKLTIEPPRYLQITTLSPGFSEYLSYLFLFLVIFSFLVIHLSPLFQYCNVVS